MVSILFSDEADKQKLNCEFQVAGFWSWGMTSRRAGTRMCRWCGNCSGCPSPSRSSLLTYPSIRAKLSGEFSPGHLTAATLHHQYWHQYQQIMLEETTRTWKNCDPFMCIYAIIHDQSATKTSDWSKYQLRRGMQLCRDPRIVIQNVNCFYLPICSDGWAYECIYNKWICVISPESSMHDHF